MTKCSVCLTVLTQMRHLTHCLLCDLSWWSSSWARLGNSRPHCSHLCSIVQYSTVQYSTNRGLLCDCTTWPINRLQLSSQNCPTLHLWAGTKTTTSGLLMKVTDFLMELEEEVESRLARLVWAGCLIWPDNSTVQYGTVQYSTASCGPGV